MSRRVRSVIAGLLVALGAAAATATAAEPAGAASAVSLRAYVHGPWGQIHVRVSGPSTGPTVILIHKMVWSSVQFERVQPLLASAGVRSLAVDLPGYGLSDGPPSQPSADDYADALLPILDAFHLSRADLVGVDTGATIAAAFTRRHPGRVRRLVLDGPPLYDRETAAKLLDEPYFDPAPRPDGSEFEARERAIRGSIAPGALSDAAIHEGVLQFFEAGPNYLFAHHAVFAHDLRSTLLGIRRPTLLLNSRGSLLHDAALRARALRPDFDYVDLPFPGMMASFDDPADWAMAVTAFVTTPH